MMTSTQIQPLPIGFRFDPTDEELLTFLLHKVVGQPLYAGQLIIEKELYRKEPWLLDHADNPALKRNHWYYYVTLEKPSGSAGKRIKRTVAGEEGGGWWQGNTGDEPIISNDGQLIGYKKSLTFFKNKNQLLRKRKNRKEQGEKSDWIMHEYRLASGSSQPWVICHIHRMVKDQKHNHDSVVTETEDLKDNQDLVNEIEAYAFGDQGDPGDQGDQGDNAVPNSENAAFAMDEMPKIPEELGEGSSMGIDELLSLDQDFPMDLSFLDGFPLY